MTSAVPSRRPTATASNEGKACDAVMRVLEAQHGARQELRSPERDGASAPIEFTSTMGGLLFAFEHTLVEPFAGHTKLQAEGRRDFDAVEERLRGRLPPDDYFELQVPVNAMQRLKRAERAPIAAALAAWIEAKAPTLNRAPFHRYDSPIVKEQPPGVPFEVSLHRWVQPRGFVGRFSVKHIMGPNLPERRETRMREVCARKFPKLAAWKRDHGARTVLVLEDNDIQLSNPNVIFDAYQVAERDFEDRPDEVHLVTTCLGETWVVDRLRVDDLTYYELPEERGTQFDSSILRDLWAELP